MVWIWEVGVLDDSLCLLKNVWEVFELFLAVGCTAWRVPFDVGVYVFIRHKMHMVDVRGAIWMLEDGARYDEDLSDWYRPPLKRDVSVDKGSASVLQPLETKNSDQMSFVPRRSKIISQQS